jgi:hypothetical protein
MSDHDSTAIASDDDKTSAGQPTARVPGSTRQKPIARPPKDKAGQTAHLGKNFEIYCDQRLPEYDSGEVLAYRAFPENDGGNYFALVCERHLMPRHKAAVTYSNIVNSSLPSLVDEGVVLWPSTKQQRYVFIYRDVLGRRLLQPNDTMALGLKQDYVLESIVKHMVTVLQDFRDKEFVHGAIRPTNMYDGGQGHGFERVFLGDCLSQPASRTQPVLFETIERSMADPMARGEGTLADDIYAFGVSLAVILRGHDPLQGLTNQDIIEAKIEMGSYAAITGKDRFKGSVLELLRGLLLDDAAQRWNVDDIITWMEGRRLSPKQHIKEKKAPRAVVFDHNKYFYASFLAMDIAKNPQETLRIVEGNDLGQWIERSLENDEMLERYEKMQSIMRGRMKGPAYDAELIAKLSMVLNPTAPLRYRNMVMMPDGIGSMLAEMLALRKDVTPVADIFATGIALEWVTSQVGSDTDLGTLISRFDRCRTYIKQTKIGYGIERCLYLICPDAYCMSEKLSGYYVRSSDDMLFAFEDMCAKGQGQGLFIDRHSAAFLAIKDPKSIESFLFELQGPENYKKILGNLKCLATIQKRMGVGKLPGLAMNLLSKMNVVFERYHDRDVREKLKSNIERFAAQGDLVKMAGILDNPDITNKDMAGFKKARQEYTELSQEYQRLDLSLDDKSTFGRSTGKEVAALISCILSAIVIMVVTILFLSNKSLF